MWGTEWTGIDEAVIAQALDVAGVGEYVAHPVAKLIGGGALEAAPAIACVPEPVIVGPGPLPLPQFLFAL